MLTMGAEADMAKKHDQGARKAENTAVAQGYGHVVAVLTAVSQVEEFFVCVCRLLPAGVECDIQQQLAHAPEDLDRPIIHLASLMRHSKEPHARVNDGKSRMILITIGTSRTGNAIFSRLSCSVCKERQSRLCS